MLPDRFWAKVEKTDGCWNWTGARAANGYGSFWWDGAVRSAHTVSFEDLNSRATVVHHKCENKACVNPAHLEGTSYRVHNSHHSNNARKTECPQGHAYDSANTRLYQGRRWCRACDNARSYRRSAA